MRLKFQKGQWFIQTNEMHVYTHHLYVTNMFTRIHTYANLEITSRRKQIILSSLSKGKICKTKMNAEMNAEILSF